MTANDLTFGIEFETTMPAEYGAIRGGYHRGLQVEWLPQGWTAEGDGSIYARGNRVGVEFVSPVLKGVDGLQQVLTVLAELKRRGARVNESCGLHIHVGGFTTSPVNLDRLTTMVSNFERAIYASTGTKKRERGSYCRGIRSVTEIVARRVLPSDRYRVLNLTNVHSGRRPAVEFRAFAGTLNEVKVVGYLRMALGLVERAIETRKVKWIAKPTVETSPIKRGGEGQTELNRLFYHLGWTKGRAKRVYGDLDCTPAPGAKQVKAELMRLAKKYDAAS
ncbi:Putative amidoligase enzyme [Pirellulimonas nuda]|uniref:Amidoligase enzyme n=1 Tax=Pirellulimonas nuda TaxID=2528009 RepID=A0A518DAD8_9BACT|nr:amidoligase family protein [Pirellulimonas nuda]QDU88386.1 Putative amidoligase enzyme [Pirellulimonas nuda]